MNVDNIQQHIEELVALEHRLLDLAGQRPLDDEQRRRLDEVNVELDRYYDLLRQRRAREEFAQNPEAAHLRSGDTVEKYLQ